MANRSTDPIRFHMRRFLVVLAVLSGLAIGAHAATKPNIIIILTDDLGYGDLGCYGHPSIRTPNLDRMAAEGLRFTDFYSAANLCTPSRAALLTGRLAIRSGMAGSTKRHVIYPENTGGLPAEEITIAEALKTQGYATACVGKWHLGHQPQFLPTSQGFDQFFGLPYSNDSDWVNESVRKTEPLSLNPDYHSFNVPLMRNTQIIERPAKQDTLTQRYTEEALRFIRENKKKPFFLYFAHTFPHVPLFASKNFRGKSPRGLYGDAVEEVDYSVGQVLKTLRDEKIADNTFVFFTSDNGPWLNKKWNGGSAGLFRDGKAGTWEGGHREPAIAWWPGRIPGGRVTSELASSLDLFPTSLAMAGAGIPNDRAIDGVDQRALLFGTGPSARDTMFFYYTTNLHAIRKDAFKAEFITHDGYSKEPVVTHDPPLLFNVQNDPGENFDVASEHPEVVAEIQKIVAEHKAKLVVGKAQY
jgi:arylsulfatase A